jgi:hypothetical protein
MLSDFSFNLLHSDTIITMNRIQFFVLTGLSSILALLLIGQIALSYSVGHAQGEWSQDQQAVQQGNIFQNDLKQLAVRIYSDSTRSTDQGLKDLLARQQITYTPSTGTNSTETPAAPPTH